MKHVLPAILTLAAAPVLAEGARELAAHEHGVGELDIAVEGKTIAMELRAPGADIVGFEYKAESAEDRAAIDAAVATLAKPLDLFVLPAAAECSVTEARAALESEDDHHEHAHDHADEEHEEHSDHGHDEHDHDKHEEHADGDDHGHDDHAEAEDSHAEFHAEYVLTCGNTGALTGIEFAYFSTFENALELEVQIVTAAGAQAFEVERDEPTLDLRGIF